MGTILVPLYIRWRFYIPSHGRRVCGAVCVAYRIFITFGSHCFFSARRMPFAFLADLQRKVRKVSKPINALAQNEDKILNSL